MSIRTTGNAIIKALEDDGMIVGDAVKPPNCGWSGTPGQSQFIPYLIVYPTGGGGVDGPLGDTRSDVQYVYQVTCIGSTREQADFMRDKVRAVMFNESNFSITGRRVLRTILDVPIATSRDDDVQPPLFFSADRFRLETSPVKGS